MRKIFIIAIIILGFGNSLFSQPGMSKFEFNGYLSAMPYLVVMKDSNLTQGLLHNRLNLHWYPNSILTFSVQFRNQLLYGDLTELGNYENGFVTENYYLPLTFQQNIEDKGLLYLSADRAWGELTFGNLDIKIGRQRINWGQTFAWNPNDIFNTYNFFDFDYVERPGADAARIQYYTGATSQLDFAAKMDSADNITAAGLFRFNKWNSDFQLIGGYYSQPHIDTTGENKSESDYVAGLGFTTDVKGVSLRSEFTYLIPTDDSPYQEDLFLASVGLDYTLPFDLSLATEFFYTNKTNLNGGDLFALYSGPRTIKNLAITKYNLMIQASYPITPLFNTTVAGMYFTDDMLTGYYAGPNFTYSLLANLDLSVYAQYFKFKIDIPGGDPIENSTVLSFLRLKWNF